jgi:DNA mismatch repair protein MutS2
LGQTVRASAAYEDLHRLLEHEDHLASVDVNLRLGYDGNIRQLRDHARVNENAAKPVLTARRGDGSWSAAALVPVAYAVRQSEVLGRMVEALFDSVQSLVIELVDLRLTSKWYLSALEFETRAEKVGLHVCIPEWVSSAEPETRLTGLFNPFLLGPNHGPIPCDMRCAREQLIVITGPNSGGKTRLLQAIGLSQLLGQSGFFVPAREAAMAWRTGCSSLVRRIRRRPGRGSFRGRARAHPRRLRTNPPRPTGDPRRTLFGTNPSRPRR